MTSRVNYDGDIVPPFIVFGSINYEIYIYIQVRERKRERESVYVCECAYVCAINIKNMYHANVKSISLIDITTHLYCLLLK